MGLVFHPCCENHNCYPPDHKGHLAKVSWRKQDCAVLRRARPPDSRVPFLSAVTLLTSYTCLAIPRASVSHTLHAGDKKFSPSVGPPSSLPPGPLPAGPPGILGPRRGGAAAPALSPTPAGPGCHLLQQLTVTPPPLWCHF